MNKICEEMGRGEGMKDNYGLHPDPYDERDVLLTPYLQKLVIPKEYDIRDKLTPVNSQGKAGACASFAGVGVKEYIEVLDYRLQLSKFIKLSEKFLYDLARKESGHARGTTLRAIMKTLKKYGVPEAKFLPYTDTEDFVDIQDEAYKNAEKYKIDTYARITNTEELKQALLMHYPKCGVLMGLNLYKGVLSEQSRRTGVVPNPKFCERSIGGHGMVEAAFCDKSTYYKNDGHFICKGSWGTKFGLEGYHIFSQTYVKKNITSAMTCTDIDDPNPYTVKQLTNREKKKLWIPKP